MIVSKSDVLNNSNHEFNVEPLKEIDAKKLLLNDAVVWLQRFLNDLGGDYTINTHHMNDRFILVNTCHCPCLAKTLKAGDYPCDKLEITINKSLKSYHPNIQAGFIRCSNDGDSLCELVITLI